MIDLYKGFVMLHLRIICYITLIIYLGNPQVKAFVGGVTAAAAGAIAGACFVLGRRAIFDVPTADNYVRQGVTTLIEGPDGSSPPRRTARISARALSSVV